MELHESPATFQRLMDFVLLGLDVANAYLDDIIIASPDWNSHLQHIETVLKRLRDAGWTVKPSKCSFGQPHVEYLGHRIGQGQVQPIQNKVDAVAKFPLPVEKKQLRSFLGLAGYYDSL